MAAAGNRTIPLTRGMVAIVDAEDYDELSKHQWYAKPSRSTFYAARHDPEHKGRKILMHKQVLAVTGKVDHRDNNGLNNCRDNLRACDSVTNGRNRLANKTSASQFKGVTSRSGTFIAQIFADGKKLYLGSFTDPVLAARAYDSEAASRFGEFAKTNAMLGLLPEGVT